MALTCSRARVGLPVRKAAIPACVSSSSAGSPLRICATAPILSCGTPIDPRTASEPGVEWACRSAGRSVWWRLDRPSTGSAVDFRER
jgi:hypothetical protein